MVTNTIRKVGNSEFITLSGVMSICATISKEGKYFKVGDSEFISFNDSKLVKSFLKFTDKGEILNCSEEDFSKAFKQTKKGKVVYYKADLKNWVVRVSSNDKDYKELSEVDLNNTSILVRDFVSCLDSYANYLRFLMITLNKIELDYTNSFKDLEVMLEEGKLKLKEETIVLPGIVNKCYDLGDKEFSLKFNLGSV